MSENRLLGSITASSIRNLLPKSVSSSSRKMKSNLRKSRSNGENVPPFDPNIQADYTSESPTNSKQAAAKIVITNPNKEDSRSDSPRETPAPPEPPVKVVVRIRPSIGRESVDRMVRKVSDSVTIGERQFSFDSVFDSHSTQEDIFLSVGVPLVKNALAGYNTSILAYGQTGSGKTYTMWGPPSAMVEAHSASAKQGIVPRIFQMLFSEIQREKENSEGKQINYQCRCSFLELYNEQIGDLLDPTHRNLEIKDDAKNGFYVENLTEEYVNSYEDVTQILIKGLSSRKIGATSVNSKSSRSHVVFTCIIESWSKGTSSKCFGSSKTSRISLIDLAGLERRKPGDADRQRIKEEKYVKKSISRLGYVVNYFSKKTQAGKVEAAPYRNSCLTHLLKESLGGNARLAVICAISPDNEFIAETMSTLRFGQQAQFIPNVPVINEITEDDVNDLTDQIRQLKEELIRSKSNIYKSDGSNHSYFNGRSVRDSLNQLRVSLNRSLILPRIDSDHEEDINIGEEDVRELHLQLDKLDGSHDENLKDTSEIKGGTRYSSVECCATELTSEHYISCAEESENEDITSEEPHAEFPREKCVMSFDNLQGFSNMSNTTDLATTRSRISISPCRQSAVLRDPPLSESPKIGNIHRKSLIISSNNLASQSDSDIFRQSCKQTDHLGSSLRTSKIFSGPTESLAASLQRGLQIINYHQRSSTSSKSPVALSFEHLTLKPCPTADASIQMLPEKRQSSDGPSASLICTSCRLRKLGESSEVQDSLKTWIVSADEAGNLNKSVPKDAEKDLAEALKREEELRYICKDQASKIKQLNHLVEQYKHHNQVRNEGCYSLKNESKLLGWINSENEETEFIKEKCEIKEVQEELRHEYQDTSFDMNEKEKLLKEIESLKSKLQSCTDVSPDRSTARLRCSSLLVQSVQLRKSASYSPGNTEEELEKERQRWMEMESDWISLTDELRIDLESNRQHAEKVEMELKLEKKCTEELDDALKRSVLGHARMVEHYAELQEKYNDLVEKHQLIMAGIADIKKAAAKAGAKGHGSRFAKSLAAELSALRLEKERERELLKRENKSLRIQLRDTAEAVHAAGELLVRLREAQEAASIAEENFTKVQEENEKLRKQMEKLKRKHKMEMITMKQYLAESRLPEAALRPMYTDDSDITNNETSKLPHDDQAWRAEFGAMYQEHY